MLDTLTPDRMRLRLEQDSIQIEGQTEAEARREAVQRHDKAVTPFT